MDRHSFRSTTLRYILIALSALIANIALADDDPPSRVARLAYISGDVSFAPAGDDQWDQVSINRPLTTGDRLLTDEHSRAAMDIDGGDLRIGSDTGFNFLRLDDSGTQLELSRGTLNWRIDNIRDGQNNEVDTPTIAFVATQPGTYRIDVSDDGSYTTISILQGAGTVYGEGGASYPVSGRQSWRFGDSTLKDIAGMPLAQSSDFDRWCNDRDSRARVVAQNDYVSPDVIGYNDLAGNGEWDTVAEYGNVWYPTTVVVGWAPYRYGHWAWVAPWGWTWIDDAPWGFAPFHYGRWVYVGNRWGWVPGPRRVRPVYCPAMVAFVGGNGWSVSVSSGAPVAWVPLGPRDVYVPWYRGSQRYVTNVNVTNVVNINRTQITNVYNDYHGNHGDRIRYMNRDAPGGTTAVSRDAFTRGNRVDGSQVRIDRAQLDRVQAMPFHELPSRNPNVGVRTSVSGRVPSQEFRRPPVLYRTPPQVSLGGRDANRNASPSFGDGRNTPSGRDNNRDQRDNNNMNNNGAMPRPPQGNGFNRRNDEANNSAPQVQPQAPAQQDNDPRWNNKAQRDNQQRQNAMPSSRFSPWGNRGEPRGQQQDAAPSQPQAPQGRDNDSRGNGNEQRNDDQRQNNSPFSRSPAWGNRGNSAPQQDNTPAQPQQPAQVIQAFPGRDDNRWNNNGRPNNAAPDEQAPQQQQQQPQPQIQQQPERSQGRSPQFGSSRPSENTQRVEQAPDVPQQAPVEQPQQRGPVQRPEFQNRGQMQNRSEQRQPRHVPQPKEREPEERRG